MIINYENYQDRIESVLHENIWISNKIINLNINNLISEILKLQKMNPKVDVILDFIKYVKDAKEKKNINEFIKMYCNNKRNKKKHQKRKKAGCFLNIFTNSATIEQTIKNLNNQNKQLNNNSIIVKQTMFSNIPDELKYLQYNFPTNQKNLKF